MDTNLLRGLWFGTITRVGFTFKKPISSGHINIKIIESFSRARHGSSISLRILPLQVIGTSPSFLFYEFRVVVEYLLDHPRKR